MRTATPGTPPRSPVRWRALLRIAVLMPGLVAAHPAPRFPPGAVWHTEVSAAPLHPQSAAMITTLAGLGGWGNGNRFQIDFSLHVQYAAANAPRYRVVAHRASGIYYLPDCEPIGTMMPVPPGAAFEGQNGLSCPNHAADCHLLIVQGRLLYELYAGNFDATLGELDGHCLAVWDLDQIYPPEGRGEHCTSADAAGFPIAALLPNADGVAAALADPSGDLGHAIRFVLPNARMARDTALGGVAGRLYVRPASHAGAPSGPSASVPYGARLRLRAEFPMEGYSGGARVILRTLQRYGMVLADGGNIALTFQSDRDTVAKWADLGIGPHTFWNGSVGNRQPVRVEDFSVLDTGPRIPETYQCVRSPVDPLGRIFRDGFET